MEAVYYRILLSARRDLRRISDKACFMEIDPRSWWVDRGAKAILDL